MGHYDHSPATVTGLSESQLFGSSIVIGVNIAPTEFASAVDLKEAVAGLIIAGA